MTALSLREEIETVINNMTNVIYLRASESEANMAVDKMYIGSKCLAIHIDRSTITTNHSTGGYIYKVVPTQILFVFKNAALDDKQTAVDVLVNNAEIIADAFYDKIIQSNIVPDMVPLPGFTAARLEAVKRFDAILSGVLFECDLPIYRTSRYC